MTVFAPWGWNMSSWHSFWGCYTPTWQIPNKQPGSGELSQLVSRLELVSLVVNILHVLSHITAGRNKHCLHWQPIPMFLPEESHGPRSLVGYSSLGRKESATTERLSTRHSIALHWKEPTALSLLYPALCTIACGWFEFVSAHCNKP